MKKLTIFALILALVFSVSALAEPQSEPIEAVQIDWDETAEQTFLNAGFSGTWYTMDNMGFKLLIPDEYQEQELTDEDRANECVLFFVNPENGGRVQIYDSTIEDYDDLESLANGLREQYPERVLQYAMINGAAAVINADEGYDMMNVIFDLGNHRFAQVMFSPVSTANQLLTLCMASIQFNI